MTDFLELARERTIIFDGAMGTQLQARNLTEDDFWGQEGFNEILNLSRPDILKEIHASYFEAGADVVETNTFGAFSIVLSEYGSAERAFEINCAGAALAKEVASSYTDRPRYVSGSIGPGTKIASLGQTTFEALESAYEVQVAGLLEGGVDLLQIETCQDLLQCKAAVSGALKAFAAAGKRLPVIVQVTIETTGTMLLGTEIGAAIVALEPLEIDFIGLNCATGPQEMLEHVKVLSAQSPKMITVLPNAGLPEIGPDGPRYTLTPVEFVEYHRIFVSELGVNGVGGCCGTTPEFIRELSLALSGTVPAARSPVLEPSVSSLYSSVTLKQETSFLVVGERTNANGSKKFRELMLSSDWEGCIQVARSQMQEGAHLLDLCVDYVGRDGQRDMAELASRLATQSTIPLVLDSTEPGVIESGITKLGGRTVINSINLEDGGDKLERLCLLARKFGAACIALLIDEEGQARDVDWKLRVANRIYQLAVGKYGLRPHDLIFDALTFPLSSGQEELRGDGVATIEAVRRIKNELPGVFTILGISNCSFGLKPVARQVLNSVFLQEAIEAGLDAAIVNAGKILPLIRIPEEQRTVARDLIFDRRSDGYDPLVEFIGLFESISEQATRESDRKSLPIEKRLEERIISGDRTDMEDDLEEALQKYSPLEVINELLLPAMKIVGDLFGKGEMQLPFVLQSAECMKAAVAYIEPRLERRAGASRGKVVLATVKGDVHDIGKNLVDIILSNNGFETINLGIKVPISEVINAMKSHAADVIGLSGLLVKSTQVMKEDLEELNRQGLYDWPVILGGAALTRSYVEADLRKVYKGPLYYGKDAFEGLRRVEEIVETDARAPEPTGEIRSRLGRARLGDSDPSPLGIRSQVAKDNPIPVPPFLGSRMIRGISLDEIVPFLNETALFRNQWQLRPGTKSQVEYQKLLDEMARPALRLWIEEAKLESLLVPQVVYGYWPARAEGNDLVVFEENATTELVRFSFPRQGQEPYLCIADFFRTDEVDYLSAFIATVGERATEKCRELFEADKYQDYLYFHGLSVEMTEALAEYWHKRIREEWGIADQDATDVKALFRQGFQGGRYSFGYPACPDLAGQVQLFQLLQPGRIGVELSESFQLQPEQSVSAIVCHHPEAKYFIVR